MNINDKIKKGLVESIIVISIMVIYMVYGIHFLPLLMILIPLPFIVLGVRNHILNNIFSIIIASMIIQILLGSTSGASLLLIFAPLSVAINYAIKKRKSNTETILISTGVFFISFLILISLGEGVSDFNLTNQIQEVFSQTIKMQLEMVKEMGLSNQELSSLASSLESQYKTVIVRIPSLLLIFSFMTSYINIFFSTLTLRKMGYEYLPVQRFSRFKLPNNIIPGMAIMFITAGIFKYMDIPYHGALLLNLSFLVGFIFIIQGLAVLDFVLIKGKVKLIFRLIILAINIIFIPISSIVFFIGVLDSIFDLRKIRKKESL